MTSLAELLDDITTRAWTDLLAGTADAADAAGALHEAARLLELLGQPGPGTGAASEERRRALLVVSSQCRLVERPDSDDQPAERGRLSELMAATRDVAATMNPPLSAAERWALACALLDPLCACAGLVRELADSPTLVDLGGELNRLRRWSMHCPPTANQQARLDQARPTTFTSDESAWSLLSRQMDWIAYRAATHDLDPSDARHVAAAGLHLAIYASTFISTVAGPGTGDAALDTCNACARSWFTVRDSVRDVIPTPHPTPWAPAVAEFARQLGRAFGPPDKPILSPGGRPSATTATAYRGLVNRLPELAQALGRAAASWGSYVAQPAIDTRVPVAWRDHTGVERYAGVAASRVDPLVSARLAVSALAARHASAALSAHADATALRLGDQPHSHLAKAYLAETRSAEPVPDSPWRLVVDRLDRRVTADAGWPALARILDLAAGEGWDVSAHLPTIALDLPDRQPAVELAYRLLADSRLDRADADPSPPAPVHIERRVSPPARVPERPVAAHPPGR
jgi:hypothetical protein